MDPQENKNIVHLLVHLLDYTHQIDIIDQRHDTPIEKFIAKSSQSLPIFYNYIYNGNKKCAWMP